MPTITDIADLAFISADYTGNDMEGFLPTGAYEGDATLHLQQIDKLVKAVVAVKFNRLLELLLEITSGIAGADQIGATAVGDGTAEKVQGILEELHALIVGNRTLAIPSTDLSGHGDAYSCKAHENVAFGDGCYLNADFEMQIGDADAVASAGGVFAMALATIAANANGLFALPGAIVRNDAWNWVAGAIYLTVTGTSGNTLSQTAPTGSSDTVIICGYALSADAMLWNPINLPIEVV